MAASKTPQQICLEFHRNPTINPSTGRPIQPGKGVYNDLVKMCGAPPPPGVGGAGRGTMVPGALPPLGGISPGGAGAAAPGAGFASPSISGGFGASTILPPLGGGFAAPPLGGGFAAPPLGGLAAPPMGGGFALPPLGGGFAASTTLPSMGGGFAAPGALPPLGRGVGAPGALPSLGGGFAAPGTPPARQAPPGVISVAPPSVLPGFVPPAGKAAPVMFPGLPAPASPGLSAPTTPSSPGMVAPAMFPGVAPTAQGQSGTLLIIHSPDGDRLFIIPETDETVEILEQARAFASGEEDPDSPDFLDFEEQVDEFSVPSDEGAIEDVNINTVLLIYVP